MQLEKPQLLRKCSNGIVNEDVDFLQVLGFVHISSRSESSKDDWIQPKIYELVI